MTLTDLSNRYLALIGRNPVSGEQVEFVRLFRDANLRILEQALDDYLRSNPDFPKLTALWASYSRRAPSKSGNEDESWLKEEGYKRYGFKFVGGANGLSASDVRVLCAIYETARGDLVPGWLRAKVNPGIAHEEGLRKMAAAAARLAAAGYVREEA